MTSSTEQRDGRLDVLLVTPAYAPSIGGVQTCARELAERLGARELGVSILTTDETATLPARERLGSVPIRRVRAWPRGGDQRFAPGVVPVVARSGADLVHVQCYQTLVAPITMSAAARLGIPYVLTFHGGGHSSQRRQRFRVRQLQILAPLLARAAALVATAEWEIGHYSSQLGLSPAKFVLIPNGGDLPEVPDRPQRPARRERPLIVSIGRAERYKGHHRVLAALPHVLDEVPDAHLWIAGEGPYEAELRLLAQRLGVGEHVEIGAVQDRRDYARRLAGASVGALLSDFETHPMGALEAINLGVPMLVGDGSGLAELADRGHAQKVPVTAGSRRHASELVALLRDPPGPARQIGLPSWDDCADAHARLYRDIVATAHARGIRR